MRSTILNRDFQHPIDGWYQIETPGEHPNPRAGLVQVIDADAVDSIVNRFNRDAKDYEDRTGRPFPGMLIDHEHFKHDSKKETVAYGWLMALENRNGVPFGKIQWTATGKPAVDGGDYRFFSTEYDPSDMKVLNPGQAPARVRPLRLDGLTLTNDPNNKGGTPITNRADPRWGPHGSQEAWEAAGRENQRHVEANKAAADTVEATRKADSEAEAAELALPALEKWFRAVKKIMDSSKTGGQQMMTLGDAFTYARAKWPALYADAFGAGDNVSSDDAAAAVEQVKALANRAARMVGKSFDWGFNFVQSELPELFNRMTPSTERVKNRDGWRDLNLRQPEAARVLNRLVRADCAIKGISDSVAFRNVVREHPGLYGLATGHLGGYDALVAEPGIVDLLSQG